MMLIVQNLFLITVPCSTILTTMAMLLPYWWSSETLLVGLWRARSSSSSWLLVEPQTETYEGRILFTLQILSFISVLLADISGIIWLIILLRRNSSSIISFTSLLSLFVLTILTYLCLSVMIYLVWQTTQDYIHLINVSYSFYLVLIIILLHSLTLISMIINLLKYRTNHHAIQPIVLDRKLSLAFNEPIV